MASGPDSAGFHQILIPETNSTNDECLNLADLGAPDGTLVRALRQTGGRGRSGRSWHSHPEASLTFSVLFRPQPREYPYLTRFTLLGCLALARVLSRNFGADPRIKWPNDVLLEGKKVSGVLVETLWQDEIPSALVLGMGVNLNDQALPPRQTRFIRLAAWKDKPISIPPRSLSWNTCCLNCGARGSCCPRPGLSKKLIPAWHSRESGCPCGPTRKLRSGCV